MDSFYDVPRRAPIPTAIETINVRPAVPEVSLVCSPKPTRNNCVVNDRLWMNTKPVTEGGFSRENVLKELQNNSGNLNQRNFSQLSNQFGRKQVRFESPVLQQRPSLGYEPFTTKKVKEPIMCNSIPPNNCAYNANVESKKHNALPKQTFEAIYMANIPNRHLDLSIVDIPKVSASDIAVKETEPVDVQKDKENELPKTYKEFLETQKKISKAQKTDPTVTDILNYKRKSFPSYENSACDNDNMKRFGVSNNQYGQQKWVSESFRTSAVQEFLPNSQNILTNKSNDIHEGIYHKHNFGQAHDTSEAHTRLERPFNYDVQKVSNEKDLEPTNRDLLKIIAQQNEQLLLLQKQLALLLNRETNQQSKAVEAPQRTYENINNYKEIDSDPPRFIPDINLTPSKRGVSKFSVDVMTSFEVAIRPQHNRQMPLNYSSKIQEITEEETSGGEVVDANKKAVEQSLHFQEPVRVVETCPSPEPSININMNDYDSSDDEVSASDIGATFYHNLMGQVNNILKQAQIQTREDLYSKEVPGRKKTTSSKANKTLHRVREATLKHLRDIGVTIGPMENDDDGRSSPENDVQAYTPTEISYGVKQLLMKYLPDDHLAKLSNKIKPHQASENRKEMPMVLEAKPDFSFASLQYMKKYNLLPSADRNPVQKEKPFGKPPTGPSNHRILDLTALKMQPKLI